MKLLTEREFAIEAGNAITHNRDFSLYEGEPYQCVCGQVHAFSQSSKLLVTNGGNAKFLTRCPRNPNAATIIKTKNKFVMFFDQFISLGGFISD